MQTVAEYLPLLYFTSFLFIPAIITKKKKPTAAIAWILTVVFIPVLGACLYLIFGTERIVNRGRKKLFANEELRKRLPAMAKTGIESSGSGDVDLGAELRDLIVISQRLSQFGVARDNEVELLVDAEQTYAEMEKEIRNASQRVHLESYIFRKDAIGEKFAGLLMEKAREGVEVCLLYDAIGSLKLGWSQGLLQELREAGVKVSEFLPLRTFVRPWNLNLRNHRKILVVDSAVGFTGSLNIGADFISKNLPGDMRWREIHLKLRGEAVAQLQWIFCEDWYFACGEDLLRREFLGCKSASGRQLAQVVASGPDARGAAIQKVFVTAVSQAKKTIYLCSPYFIPDQALLLALQVAALRGVDVRILLPHMSDHHFVSYAGRAYYDDLRDAGVRIFEYMDGCLHSKMLIVDDHFTVIGSANVDVRSFSYNFELNVQIYGEAVALKAKEIFFDDLANSREVPADFANRPRRVRFAENLCRLFSPVL